MIVTADEWDEEMAVAAVDLQFDKTEQGELMFDRYLMVISQRRPDGFLTPIVVACQSDDDADRIAAAFVAVMELDADVEITNLDEGIRAADAAGKCPHGIDPAECDDCFVASDHEFDADREDRFFGFLGGGKGRD